jgi:hypothetical protein
MLTERQEEILKFMVDYFNKHSNDCGSAMVLKHFGNGPEVSDCIAILADEKLVDARWEGVRVRFLITTQKGRNYFAIKEAGERSTRRNRRISFWRWLITTILTVVSLAIAIIALTKSQ